MLTGARSRSVDRNLLGDQVYELLKSEILTGDLRPRERVTVAGLAIRFGLSPTPVRDALRRLSTDGLVKLLPRRGTVVTAFDQKSVREVFQIRRIIECAAVEAVPRAPRATLSRMRELVLAMEDLRAGETFADYPAFIVLDAEFHRCMIELLDSSRLVQFYETLRWPILVIRGLSQSPFQRANATVAEHRRIADACRRRDVQSARGAVLDHLRNAEADLIRRVPGEVGDAARPASRRPP